MKLNNSDDYESIEVFVDPVKHPIAFKNRVASLMESGMTEEEASEFARQPLEMELYYDKDAGLFLVESEAVECGTIYNPYDGQLMEGFDEIL